MMKLLEIKVIIQAYLIYKPVNNRWISCIKLRYKTSPFITVILKAHNIKEIFAVVLTDHLKKQSILFKKNKNISCYINIKNYICRRLEQILRGYFYGKKMMRYSVSLKHCTRRESVHCLLLISAVELHTGPCINIGMH